MRGLCKEADYFITDEKDRVQAMMDVETLCDGLQLLQLKDLVSRVEDAKDDKVNARKVIKQEVRTEKESFFLFYFIFYFLWDLLKEVKSQSALEPNESRVCF